MPGRPYVIGADTAGDGSDWFVGQVLDNVSGEQVAVLRHRYDEDTFSRQMYCLGKWYNDAMLAPEANFSTYPVKLLDLMGYRNLYVREIEDTFDGTIRHAFGFRTDRLTRPVIISELIRVMREHLETVNDEDTLLEMLTFVRDENQKAAAEPGAHDDCVMALAIAPLRATETDYGDPAAAGGRDRRLGRGYVGRLQPGGPGGAGASAETLGDAEEIGA